jgi:tetratricopeptide (TPR) repeat protein
LVYFLVLRMQKIFIIAFICLGWLACSNNNQSKEDSVLSRAPYEQLTDSIAKEPANAGLYFRRGTLLYKNEQLTLAENDLRRAWELNPTEEYALRLTTVLKQKNVDTAINFIQEALKKTPNSISLRVGLARGFQKQGRIAEAENICTKIIQDFPGQLDALTLKAELLKQQNKDQEAIAVLERAYEFAPEDVDLVHQLAFAYAEARNPKVLGLCDSLIKVDVQKRHAEPYYFKGLYYENLGNSSQAISYFDQAIQHDFNFMDAYLDKGQTFFDQKKYPEAFKTFELATKVFPTEGEPYYWLGKTQEAVGNKEEARANYQRAYGFDNTITEAKEAADRLK